jgi:transcriptional antiterminator RfaH
LIAWHLARSYGAAGRAEQSLQRMQFEVFAPTVIELRKIPSRNLSHAQRHSAFDIMRPRAVPLFPGYLFIRLDLQTARWREAFGLAGVGGLVVHGGLPAVVETRLIEHLQSTELHGDTAIRCAFGAGDRVAVRAGPFGGYRGTVERALDLPLERLDPETRIKVMLCLFGQTVPVEVPHWQLEAGGQLATQ